MALPGTTYKKLSVNQWLEIVNLAENGMPIAKIAQMFGVHNSIVYAGLKKRNVVMGGRAKAAEEEAAAREVAVLVGRIKETKDKHYRYTNVIIEMMMKKFIECEKEKKTISLDDVKAYKLAISALKDGTGNNWKILGLDKENADVDKALPELPIRELTELEVQTIRDRQNTDDELEGLDSLPDDLDDLESEADLIEEDPAF